MVIVRCVCGTTTDKYKAIVLTYKGISPLITVYDRWSAFVLYIKLRCILVSSRTYLYNTSCRRHLYCILLEITVIYSVMVAQL